MMNNSVSLSKPIQFQALSIKTLPGRLTWLLTIGFLILSTFIFILLTFANRVYQQEVTQVMHQNLASYVAGNYLVFENGELDLEVAKRTFHDLMILGPNFEFYVVDLKGDVLAYSAAPNTVVRKSIRMNPIHRYLSGNEINCLIKGDDPRAIAGEKIFSVAPIIKNNQTQGYLYVILGSQIYDKISDQLWNSKLLHYIMFSLLAGLILGIALLLVFTHWITRPLTQLTQQVIDFQVDGVNQAAGKNSAKPSHSTCSFSEQTSSLSDISALRSAFQSAFETIQIQYNNIVTIDELRKELLSHVSHDLRTPLASLLGYLETWELQFDQLTEKQSRQYIGIAKKNAERISSLVEQLFELAHLDSGDVQVNKEQFSVAELIHDVLQKFRIEAEKKGISLSVTPQDSRVWVFGDIEKMERVFVNLIDNALRHTPAHGAIHVRLNEQGHFVSIEVSDTGIGIPESDIPFIFDPHFKAGNSVRGNTAHGGLGLAITKRLLELHQSKIEVSSQENIGTCFRFSLPTQLQFETNTGAMSVS